MVGWHHQLNGHEFDQAPGVGEGNREAWQATVHGVTEKLDTAERLTLTLIDSGIVLDLCHLIFIVIL